MGPLQFPKGGPQHEQPGQPDMQQGLPARLRTQMFGVEIAENRKTRTCILRFVFIQCCWFYVYMDGLSAVAERGKICTVEYNIQKCITLVYICVVNIYLLVALW